MLTKPEGLTGEPIIFTDLDGTLLDHHSYSFAPAKQALAAIAERGIPLIINSSKTFAEVKVLHHALGLCYPVICENGAAVYCPVGDIEHPEWHCHAFAEPRQQVLAVLAELRAQGYPFRGFADCNAQDIAVMTGLSLEEAELAGQRDFSEPLQWLGDEAAKQAFLSRLADCGLQAMQGGRFLTVCSNKPCVYDTSSDKSFNKGKAMHWLCQQWSDRTKTRWLTVALGDSPNDFPMLAAADIAVLVRAQCEHDIHFDRAKLFLYTKEQGPAGWQEAMEQLLPWFAELNNK